jgi:cytochrome P450
MPKWNPVFGHLLVMNDVFKRYRLPPDIQRPDIFADLSQCFEASDSLFYMDLWPFINTLLLTSSPNYGLQVGQQDSIASDRPEDLVDFLHPISGGVSIFTTNGHEWKHERNVFSAGFNSSYILSQTDHIVQEAEVYIETLREHANKKEVFLLDEVTIKYTMDISGLLTLWVF